MILSSALLAYSRTSFSISTGIRLAPMAALSAARITTMSYSNPRRSLHMSESVKSPATEQTPSARSHLVSFFAQYPDFEYNPDKPFMNEFWRLVETNKFGRRGKRFKLARKGVKEAILLQFRDIYGAHSHSCVIHVWNKLFKTIGVEETLPNCGLYHKRAKSIHLNICDLIDRPATGIDIKTFPSVEELGHYTFENKDRPKIAPPISKKEDPIVGRLYRRVSNPPKAEVEDAPSVIPSSPAEVVKEAEDVIHGASA